MSTELATVLVAVVSLAGVTGVAFAYRRRKGHLDVRVGDASVSFTSSEGQRPAPRGLTIAESTVSKSEIDVMNGASVNVTTSKVKRSRLTAGQRTCPPEPPARRDDDGSR